MRRRLEETRSKPLRDKHDEIVAIVTANPGISIGQIRQQLPPTESRTLVGTLTQLCMDKRIEYRPVNSNRRSPPLYREGTPDACQRWEEFARGEDSIGLQSDKLRSQQTARWMTRRTKSLLLPKFHVLRYD